MGSNLYVVSGLFACVSVVASATGYAEEKLSIPGSVFAVTYHDSVDIPSDPHYRCRAIFKRDVRDEEPISFLMERIELPDRPGNNQFHIVWTEEKSVKDFPGGVSDAYAGLPLEIRSTSTEIQDLKWDDAVLKFNVKVGNSVFKCSTSDCDKSHARVSCEAK